MLAAVLVYFAFLKKPGEVAVSPTPTPTPTKTVTPTPTKTATPTPDETANWKTYTNTKYGFEFKYPATLFVNEDDICSKGLPSLDVDSDLCDVFLKSPTTPYFVIFGLSVYKTREKAEEQIFRETQELGPYERRIIELAAGSATEAKLSRSNRRLIIVGEAPTIIFSEDLSEKEMDQLTGGTVTKKEFDQILSTFKFTK